MANAKVKEAEVNLTECRAALRLVRDRGESEIAATQAIQGQ